MAAGWMNRIQFLAQTGIFLSPPHADKIWGSPSLLSD